MTKVIKQIRILVACPGDVENIKDLIIKCCESCNPELIKGDQIEFVVIHWKKDVRAAITGERPQDIINKQYDELEYDIFIGIFWKRFGEKQSNGKTPTEEEFERAYDHFKKKGQPRIVKIYFKQDNISLPSNKEEIIQLGEVLDFQDKLKDSGIYSIFTEENFLLLFQRELLNFLYKFKEPAQEQNFAKIIKYDFNNYHIKRKLIKAEDYNHNSSFFSFKPAIESIELLKKTKNVVILGDAGSGKTQEIDYLANYFSTNKENLFPIKIKLKSYVDQDIERYIPEAYNEFNDDNIILLLDGFDEVESKNKLTLVRKIIFYVDQHSEAKFVITCRTNSYRNEFDDFKTYYLTNLDDGDIDNYLSEN